MRRILHISDIHFGPKHLPPVADGVSRLVAARRPDLVVLSGDLTQRAKPEQFRQARRFVDDLPAPVIAVPGNHDVPLYRVWERVFAPYGAYRAHFDPELEPVFEDDELLALGINTAHGWTLTEGRIRWRRLREIQERLAATAPGKLRLVVAHHHLIPPPRFGTQSVSTNAFEAIQVLADGGVDLVLSGHHHQTYIGTSEEFYPSGRRPVLVVHSGTTTSSRGRGSEATRNTCNWIEAGRHHLVVSNLEWRPEEAEFRECARHVYPRRSSPRYELGEYDAGQRRAKGGRSMSEAWEVLEVVGTEEDAALIAGYLRSCDIDCEIESVHSHEFPVNVTVLGEVRIEVPASQLDRARELLDRRDETDLDDSTWEEGAGNPEESAS